MHAPRPQFARALAVTAALVGATAGLGVPVGCHGGDSGAPPSDAAVIYEAVPEIAPAARRDVASSAVVYDDARRAVLVATGEGGALVRFDPETSKREVVALGGDLRSVALSPDGLRLLVVDRGSQGPDPKPGRALLLDASTLAVLWSQPLDGHPRAAIFDPARPRFAYVAVEDSGAVAVLDRATHSLAATIPIGRLPSGLAASRLRDELVVTRRIDGVVHVVDRTARNELAQIPLADSPPTVDRKVPQGRPFAFESLAWAPDGLSAWLPHQTYDGAVALQFQSVVFPAVSVVDFDARAERTNAGAGSKRFPGRKELFGAINVTSGGGDAQIVSGPCAAALHPNGQRAYVLACASDDLLVFDAASGAAAEIVKLPGDHASALALDAAGARAFVLSDQSETLSVLDLGGGSPIAHPSLVGAPIALLDVDPVAPEMRRATTLFLRADHHKTFADDDGTARALSGQSWMACGSCHLDGLATTNAFLFEASPRLQPAAAKDAQIGHRALRDFFSTAARPDEPAFDPHDLVVAMLDMGGLARDTTGKDRGGATDPAAPSKAVTEVARALARIVARDMPLAPSWLLQQKAPAGLAAEHSTGADAAYCGGCHKPQYDSWQKSAHSHAAQDPFVSFSADLEKAKGGESSIRHCLGCHDPNGVRLGNPSLTAGQGVTCTSCHDVHSLIQAGGNADLRSVPHDWSQDHKASASERLTLLRTSAFCAGCHESFVPGNGLIFIDTLNEWKASPFAPHDGSKGKACVTCHMPVLEGPAGGGGHDHGFIGGNITLAARFPVAGWREQIEANLRTAAQVVARKQPSGGKVDVDIKAVGVGHLLPTGVPDLRELWIQLEGQDGSGAAVRTVGAPAVDTGALPDDAARLGLDLASADGTLLHLHELGVAASIPFDRRVAPNQVVRLTLDGSALYADPAVKSVEAQLHYRNVRPAFYRAALGDPTALPPDVVIGRAKVE